MPVPLKKYRVRILWIAGPFLIALVVFIRWDSWFYNPPEPSYFPPKTPDKILLTWSGDPCTTRNVTWQCDTSSKKGTLFLVNLTTASDTSEICSSRSVIQTQGGAAAYFKASVENLSPGNQYAYRIKNDDGFSDWYEFKTDCPSDSAFSFIYIGDVQDSVNGLSGDLFHKAYRKGVDASFLLFIGDLVERPHDAYWKEWFRAGGDLFKTLPVIATPGNHEYYKGITQKLDARWLGHFSFPLNGPEDFMGRVCYWDYGNTRFISLDTNGIQSFQSALEQRNWLKEVLEQTKQRWTVVLMHHPVYTLSRKHDNLIIRKLFKPLFDKYGVDLVLQGHDHAYGRAAHILNSDASSKQGPVYVISHASPKLYDLKFQKFMDRLATNTQMFQVISISKDSISYKAYTMNETLYDAFTLVKDPKGDNSIKDNIPYDSKEHLLPTKDFLTRNLEDLSDYNKEMMEWENSKISER